MAYYLSLDCSTKSTGWAIFNEKELIDYGCITITSKDLIKRIKFQTKEIKNLLQKYNFDTIILEEVRPDIQGRMNVHTWKALMWLQASINFMLYDNNSKIKIEYMYPSEWRSKCGIPNGKTIKRELAKQLDIKFVHNTYNITVNDDIADAIGIGHSYINNLTDELYF